MDVPCVLLNLSLSFNAYFYLNTTRYTFNIINGFVSDRAMSLHTNAMFQLSDAVVLFMYVLTLTIQGMVNYKLLRQTVDYTNKAI